MRYYSTLTRLGDDYPHTEKCSCCSCRAYKAPQTLRRLLVELIYKLRGDCWELTSQRTSKTPSFRDLPSRLLSSHLVLQPLVWLPWFWMGFLKQAFNWHLEIKPFELRSAPHLTVCLIRKIHSVVRLFYRPVSLVQCCGSSVIQYESHRCLLSIQRRLEGTTYLLIRLHELFIQLETQRLWKHGVESLP